MNILFVHNGGRRIGSMRLGSMRLAMIGLLALLVLPGGSLVGGYYLGKEYGDQPYLALIETWQQQMAEQRQGVEEASQTLRQNMDAMAMRLGQLQAHVIRLDALGSRLTKMADLDKGEFDFSTVPAQGGPVESSAVEPMNAEDFMTALSTLSHQLEDRSQQLEMLETMMMNRNLQDEVLPAGRPIQRGWISSFFGMRTDPFSGHKEHHDGVDFAGKEGSAVYAVASGVVVWAGDRYGYGQLVEINHGNGYATRYGHNKEVKVKIGDTVKKGQTIALMGSTGRSTGPHVHFEVLREGKQVNPASYIKAAR